MFSLNGTSASIKSDWDSIGKAAAAIKSADCVVIGVGSGMTAAGGFDYTDPTLAEKWYPAYIAMGKRSIIEIMSSFWPTAINEMNAAAFWGFWARHIWHIRYEAEALQPYRDLFSVVEGKDYFICTTNVDGQLEKAGFSKDKIFAPQGAYALLQCEKPCSQDVYPNKEMIGAMLGNMVSPFEIRQEDIPRCPRCGRFLVPNLRCDFSFVEKPHMVNAGRYEGFINEAQSKKMVFLELGVGFNTPSIIRYPFERMAKAFQDSMLIRINDQAAGVPKEIASKAICIQGSLLTVMPHIKS